MRTNDSQLRKGVLELAVLTSLAGDRAYGGELLERFSDRPALGLSSGTLYPLLTRLRRAGLVTTSWQESPVGPPRKYYELTPAGRDHLKSLTRSWLDLSAAIDDLIKEKP